MIFLVDCRRDPNAEDRALLDALRARQLPAVVVATKMDKMKTADELGASMDAIHSFFELPDDQPLFFSSATRQGRPELWARVNDLLFGGGGGAEDEEDAWAGSFEEVFEEAPEEVLMESPEEVLVESPEEALMDSPPELLDDAPQELLDDDFLVF